MEEQPPFDMLEAVRETVGPLIDQWEVDELQEQYGPVILRTEAMHNKEKGHCYCGDCCRLRVEEANDAIWAILDHNETKTPEEKMALFEQYQYHVIKDGLHSKILQGQQELDEYNYGAWWKGKTK